MSQPEIISRILIRSASQDQLLKLITCDLENHIFPYGTQIYSCQVVDLEKRIEIWQNSSYEVWYNFFLSYAEKRAEFVQNEIVEKLSENEAKVSFEITNLEGLTDLSASREIIEKEAEMGVTTEIL